MAHQTSTANNDPDSHKGAIEGDRPGDEQHWNRNAPALDDCGLPADPTLIEEDRIGANVEDTEVAQANETGRTNDAPREEERPLTGGKRG
jgi:hypothetical protein